MRQKVFWVEWVKDPEKVTGGTFKPMKMGVTPKRVYSLFNETDPNKKPSVPIKPVHGENCFYEDWVHDWNIGHEGTFRYYTRIANYSLWILVEYEEPIRLTRAQLAALKSLPQYVTKFDRRTAYTLQKRGLLKLDQFELATITPLGKQALEGK